MAIDGDIAAFLDQYRACWGRGDYDGVLALWDEAEPNPIYVAEEADPCIGWDAIRKYFDGNRKVLARTAIRTWNLQTRQPAPDMAIAFYEMQWNAKLAASVGGAILGGFNRVSGVLRRKPEGWRLFHYVEAPLAAPVYVRRVAGYVVDPDFHAANKD